MKIVTGAVLLHYFRKQRKGKMSLENYSCKCCVKKNKSAQTGHTVILQYVNHVTGGVCVCVCKKDWAHLNCMYTQSGFLDEGERAEDFNYLCTTTIYCQMFIVFKASFD